MNSIHSNNIPSRAKGKHDGLDLYAPSGTIVYANKVLIVFILIFCLSCKKNQDKSEVKAIKSSHSEKTQDSNKQNWDGNYYLKTKVESIEKDEQIDMEYYINIDENTAILSIKTQNPIEAYCEGDYSISKQKSFIHLLHTGETGICTSNIEDSSFDIKKENGKYYIRSKRFLDMDWKQLEVTK